MKAALSLALFVVVGLIATSQALPARKRMVYYQQPAASWLSAPQRMMYVQYVQPSRTHARSTQAAAALVAGESVATGTYLQDCDHAEADLAAAGPVVDIAAEENLNDDDVLSAAGAHGASSVAEAYPFEAEQQDDVQAELEVPVDVPAVSDDAAKVPRDYNFEAAAEEASAAAAEGELTVEADVAPAVDVAVAAELPAPAPIAPVATPAKRYLPANKKVYVELEQSSDEAEDAAEDDENENAVAVQEEEVEEDDDTDVAAVVPVAPKYPARVPNARRPIAKKPVKPAKAAPCTGCAKAKNPAPQGTFFPIDFGGTSGGAIAIANSFSTGEGGSATSHAIAYGSPDAARARVRPSKRH